MQFQVVIPARGKSKRFPNKNLAHLAGIPLIAHSIKYAQKTGFTDVWVNSEDEEILKVSAEFGAKTVLRPSELASDTSASVEVLKHQIRFFKEKQILCEAIILLQPTNPIRPIELLNEAIAKFIVSEKNSLATFSGFRKKFGIIIDNKFIPSNYIPGQRSQDLEPLYFENGLLYITKTDSILKNEIITSDCLPFIVDPKYAMVDIDYEEDLLVAEVLYKKFRKNG